MIIETPFLDYRENDFNLFRNAFSESNKPLGHSLTFIQFARKLRRVDEHLHLMFSKEFGKPWWMMNRQ